MRGSGAKTVGETLRAVADAVVPDTPDDPTPGASSINAERFVEQYLRFSTPGWPELAASTLDQMSSEFGRPFAGLARSQRAGILHALCDHDDAELRELGNALISLSIAAVYGEWSGVQDGHPLGWDLTGFAGPRSGVPSLMRET